MTRGGPRGAIGSVLQLKDTAHNSLHMCLASVITTDFPHNLGWPDMLPIGTM